MDFYNRTWTDVVNKALASLGREMLQDIDQEGSDAELARLSLPEAVSICAGYFDWTFLRRQEALSPDNTTTGPFSYSYSLPSDAMRVTKVDTQEAEFFIMENKVCTDSEHCTVTYQALPEGVVTQAPFFTSAVVHYLTFLMAKSLTGNDALRQLEYQLWQEDILKAKRSDRAWLPKKGARWWTEEKDA